MFFWLKEWIIFALFVKSFVLMKDTYHQKPFVSKVNKKYKELLEDLEKDYKDACNELGPEEVAALLEKQLEASKKLEQELKPIVPDTRKDGKNFWLILGDIDALILSLLIVTFQHIKVSCFVF